MTSDPEITWVGHSTILLDLGGTRVLTDPLLTRRVAHLRRRRPLPSPDTADVDVVLLSHAHMDHLHLPSLRRVAPRARLVAPEGCGPLLRAAGLFDITEVNVGDRVDLDPVTIEVVPAQHKAGRGPHSGITAPPVGYVIDDGARRFYFPGDTALFPEMADLVEIDVAFLPIWGWGPTVGSGHLDPSGAVEASRLITPELIVPMHWGTYSPEDGRRGLPSWFEDPLERFADGLGAAGGAGGLRALEPGDTLVVPPRRER